MQFRCRAAMGLLAMAPILVRDQENTAAPVGLPGQLAGDVGTPPADVLGHRVAGPVGVVATRRLEERVPFGQLLLDLTGGERRPRWRAGPKIGSIVVRLETSSALHTGSATKKPAPEQLCCSGAGWLNNAGGDLLSRGSSIIGPAVLTAVFGKGTGVSPRVWPPAKAGVRGEPPAGCGSSSSEGGGSRGPGEDLRVFVYEVFEHLDGEWTLALFLPRRLTPFRKCRRCSVRVVKLSAVSTGCLRRFPAVQLRPINRVVYPGPAADRSPHGTLVLALASRLDAFSVYPFPTWLPSRALSRTTGTPGVGPSQSSRTREESPSRFPRARQIGTDLAHAGLNPARVPL